MTKKEELKKLKKHYERRQAAYNRVCDRCDELFEQLNDERTHLAIIQTEMHRLSMQIAAIEASSK